MERVACAVCIAVFVAGCTRGLRPNPEVPKANGPPFALRAELVVDDALFHRQDVYGSFLSLGYGNKWVCETGAGLVPALERTLKLVFSDVKTVPAAGSAEVTLTPHVLQLRYLSELGGFWIGFELQVQVVDAAGTLRLSKSYFEQDEGSVGIALMLGPAAAAPSLLSPTERAMARVLEKLVVDLRETFLVTGGGPPPQVQLKQQDVRPPSPATAALR